jgi:hypothetical protein
MATKPPLIAPDIEPGNIDLLGRKRLMNPDGRPSSVSSMSVGFDENGHPVTVLIPTVVNGKRLNEDQAIDYYLQSGQHLGKFSNHQLADAYSKLVSGAQAVPTELTIFDAIDRAIRGATGGY